MPTGKKYFNASANRVVSQEDMRDNIVDYMRESDKAAVKLVYPDQAVIGSSETTLSSSVNDTFTLDSATIATDGLGNVLDTTDDHSTYFEDVNFENTSPDEYDVALTYAVVPSGININGRTALPEYDTWEEVVGFSADPTSLIDNGSNLTFDVSNLFDTSIDNTGRTVMVWKKVPAQGASTEAIAIETQTVFFSGSSNQILTDAAFGQTTPSTTASDYTVCLLGPVVLKDTDLTDTEGYAYIGTITSNGPAATPTAFDVSQQRLADATYGAIADISRFESSSPNQYKVSVSATSGDQDETQVEVKDTSANVVFNVDGYGVTSIVIQESGPSEALYVTGGSFADGVVGLTTLASGSGLKGQTVSGNGSVGGTFTGHSAGGGAIQIDGLSSDPSNPNASGGGVHYNSTDDVLKYYDSSEWKEILAVGAAGDVSIGGTFTLSHTTEGEIALIINNANTTAADDGSLVQFKRDASAALSGADIIIGGTEYFGDDGTSLDKVAACYVKTGGLFGVNDNPTKMEWWTTADGSGTLTKRMEINEDGNVEIVGDLEVGDSITCDGTSSGGAGSGILQVSNSGTGRAVEMTSTNASGTALYVNSDGTGISSISDGIAGAFTATDDSVAIQAQGNTSAPLLIVPQTAPSTSVVEGCIYYNSGSHKLYVRTDSAWVALH